MVSLVYWFINLFPRKIIQVRRMPPHTVIRAHLAGLTLAMILVLFTQGLNISSLDFFPVILFTAIFALGTYIGGPFVILVTLFSFGTAGTLGPGFLSSLYHLTDWYFIGYIFGGIFATLYNDLVFLYMISFGKRRIALAFAYDKDEPFNIVKSPIKKEERNILSVLKNIPFFVLNIRENIEVDNSAAGIEKLIRQARRRIRLRGETVDKQRLSDILEELTGKQDFNEQLDELKTKLISREDPVLDAVENKIDPLVEKYLRLSEKKLYDYDLSQEPDKPYTIAFVANPKILTRRKPDVDYDTHRKNNANYETDPIIRDRDLFMRSVDRALFALERDEVVGQPGIWSRVRIITIFDEKLKDDAISGVEYGLVEEFQDNIRIDDRVIENLVDAMEQMLVNNINGDNRGNFVRMLEKSQCRLPDKRKKITIKDIDVIYAFTAAPLHDRSTAHYSDWLESQNGGPDDLVGCLYHYDPDPNQDPDLPSVHGYPKNSEINVHRCEPKDSQFLCVHEDSAEHPGRVALNVIGARQKTFIHEFAHAMSSAYRGAIVDEYFDRSIIRKSREDNASDDEKKEPFYANRIARSDNGKIIPVHRIFARYNGETYRSDKDHPSAEEDWSGYFPERSEADVGCTMDRTIGRYRFDKLLSTFMYERLVSKLNRPNPKPLTKSSQKERSLKNVAF